VFRMVPGSLKVSGTSKMHRPSYLTDPFQCPNNKTALPRELIQMQFMFDRCSPSAKFKSLANFHHPNKLHQNDMLNSMET
jgi:hypothetical protein